MRGNDKLHRVVVLFAVVAQSYWFIIILLVFVESAHWLASVRVDFYRAVVYLREGLQLDVVAPHAVLSLSLDVLVEVVFPAHYKLHEKLLLVLDVV